MIDKYKISIFLALWFGLHLTVVLGGAHGMWGIHLIAFFPLWVHILVLIGIGALFIPTVGNGSMQIATWLCIKIPWQLQPILLAGFAFLMFYLFPSTTHFLGDGALLLRELEQTNAGEMHLPDRAPLVFYLIGLLKNLGITAEMTYRLYSWMSGVLYVLLAFWAAHKIGQEQAQKIIALGLFLSPGFMLLFFGYIETYALLLPMNMAYLLASLYAIQDKRAIYVPAILLGILIPLHLMHILLVPSLIICAHRQVQKGVISLIITGGIACALLWLLGLPPWQIFEQSGGAAFLSFAADFHRPYSLFSFERFIDLCNHYLLVVPTSVGILFLSWRKLKPTQITEIFLLTAALFPILFTLLANAKIGAFRDWDVMGVATLPLLFWSVWVFVRNGNMRSSGTVLVGIGALHLILWVGINADPAKAEMRFKTALHTSTLSPYAQSYGWDTLGGYYRSHDQLLIALDACQKALKADPKHPRHWNAAGNLYRRMGKPTDAIYHFQQAVSISPNFASAHSNLGNALNQLGRYNEAITAYEHALSLDADLPETYTNLGVTYYTIGQYQKSAQYHLQALKYNPNFVDALSNLGNTYNAMGNYNAARDVLLQAIQLAPNNAFPQTNIGNTYLGLQDFNEALKHLDMALQLRPNLVAAHFNRGIAFANLKQLDKAVEEFQTVIRLDPKFVAAYHSLGMVYDQLNQSDQVRMYYQKVLELNPNYPHAALIQKWFQENL